MDKAMGCMGTYHAPHSPGVQAMPYGELPSAEASQRATSSTGWLAAFLEKGLSTEKIDSANFINIERFPYSLKPKTLYNIN
jgi:hypothetical protein